MFRGAETQSLLFPVALGPTVARVGHSLLYAALAFGRRRPLGAVGGLILLGTVVVAVFSSVIAPFDPYEVHVRYKYAGPGVAMDDTDQRFWLGTDQLGRDTLSRVIYGARISLSVSL